MDSTPMSTNGYAICPVLYERGGALPYLAAWDVRRGIVMGRCEPSTGIVPFGRLVAQVMASGKARGLLHASRDVDARQGKPACIFNSFIWDVWHTRHT
jgi:hypothetical protein